MARPYTQLTHLERKRIEEGLDAGTSLRRIAEALGRSASTVSREVAQNRMRKSFRPTDGRHCAERAFCAVTGVCGERCPYGGEGLCSLCSRVACATRCPRYEGLSRRSHLNRAPWVCNGCKRRRSCRAHRDGQWLYDADAADAAAKARRSESRRGIDMDPEEAAATIALIKDGLARSLSPYEIWAANKEGIGVSESTIHRWIEAGYGGMANIELERKVGFRKRRRSGAKRVPTRHTARRSHGAFLALPEEDRQGRWEMDTVLGRTGDRRCILTLYHVPTRFQLGLLLKEKTEEEVLSAVRGVASLLGREAFSGMFALVLTDNGSEFGDEARLARAFGERKGAPPKPFYCDVRASEQKGSCEKNHSELRQILPKGEVDFDALTERDVAVAMSHANSNPRRSLCGSTPIRMFKAMFEEAAEALLDAFGMEEVAAGELMLRRDVLNLERARRGEGPIMFLR